MRILFVHPVTSMSVGDVARGYRSALARLNHDIQDYHMGSRFAYHKRALPEEMRDPEVIARCVSENILNEALYHRADVVLIVSGLNVWPGALWLLGQVGIPAAVIFTESPYDDEFQKQWADLTHVNSKVDLTFFTNDRFSSLKHGWNLIAPAFDPEIHRPVAAQPEHACDVLMVGTGWPERQAFLEKVDWAGIDFQLHGLWTGIDEYSKLKPFYKPGIIDNKKIAEMYCSAKINININRVNQDAMTPGPRVYELAACGAFQVSDPRVDMVNLFGKSIPTFTCPEELNDLIHYYLDHEHERKVCAAGALDAVLSETFDNRAEVLEMVLERHLEMSRREVQPVT